MIRRTFLAVLALASLGGCMHSSKADGFKMLPASEANAKQTSGAKLVFADANPTSFREKHGVVPGAILLSNYKDYAASELPADKDSPLVFYCANTL